MSARAPILAAAAPVQVDLGPRPDTSRYASWTPQEVANYFSARGYGEYAELWVRHRLSGSRVVLLSPSDLEQMGIACIGDRLGIQQELRVLKSAARQAQRNAVVAEHFEAYPGSCFEQAIRTTCCPCFCPWERSHFSLTSSTLKIRNYHVQRCFGCSCTCFGGRWATDTVRLDRIVDVDTIVTVKGCACCSERKCTVEVTSQAGTHAESDESRITSSVMLLDAPEGEVFAQQIRDQMDEYKTLMTTDAKDKA